MNDKVLQFAYAAPILAAVIQVKGLSDLDGCITDTCDLIQKLGDRLQ